MASETQVGILTTAGLALALTLVLVGPSLNPNLQILNITGDTQCIGVVDNPCRVEITVLVLKDIEITEIFVTDKYVKTKDEKCDKISKVDCLKKWKKNEIHTLVVDVVKNNTRDRIKWTALNDALNDYFDPPIEPILAEQKYVRIDYWNETRERWNESCYQSENGTWIGCIQNYTIYYNSTTTTKEWQNIRLANITFNITPVNYWCYGQGLEMVCISTNYCNGWQHITQMPVGCTFFSNMTLDTDGTIWTDAKGLPPKRFNPAGLEVRNVTS